ncbi:MAG: Molecular chaperone GrpE [Chlorobi bacterium OLB5]|nr:MAG: Molecular chaperone GrpE [Chlorobi bacterium OLB5]
MTKNKKEKPEQTTEKLKDTEIKINGEDTKSSPDSDNDNKISELEKQSEQFKDLYLRTAAEFENYKKRTDSERAEFFAYAGEKVLTDLLPVLDDFDRTMGSFEKSHDKDALKKGIDLVYEKFRSVLEKQGLKIMESDGKKFDVNLHEAIMQQPDETKEPETILNTVEKGYFLKDKVLRHAKVVVSS